MRERWQLLTPFDGPVETYHVDFILLYYILHPSQRIGKDLYLGRKLDYNLYRRGHVEADNKYLSTDTPFGRGMGYSALSDPSGVAGRNEIQGQYIDYAKIKMPPAPGKKQRWPKKIKSSNARHKA
ncbi:MAG: hypothetical protein ACR2M6_03300 [Vampirovibrionia bacterium]